MKLNSQKFISHSPEETEIFAKKFAEKFLPKCSREKSHAVVVGLYGDLGSGKTTFAQAIGRVFGIKSHITSPTFVIEKIYPLIHSLSADDSQFFTQLIHIDAYRLENSEELIRLGWNDIVQNQYNIIFIEWPERVESLLPEDHVRLKFTFIDEMTREIEMSGKMVQ